MFVTNAHDDWQLAGSTAKLGFGFHDWEHRVGMQIRSKPIPGSNLKLLGEALANAWYNMVANQDAHS